MSSLRTLLGVFVHPVRTLREVPQRRLTPFAVVSLLYLTFLASRHVSPEGFRDVADAGLLMALVIPVAIVIVPAAAWLGCRTARLFGKRPTLVGLLNVVGLAGIPRALGGVAYDLSGANAWSFSYWLSSRTDCYLVVLHDVGALYALFVLVLGLATLPSKRGTAAISQTQTKRAHEAGPTEVPAAGCEAPCDPSMRFFVHGLCVSTVALIVIWFLSWSSYQSPFQAGVESLCEDPMRAQTPFSTVMAAMFGNVGDVLAGLTLVTVGLALAGLLIPRRWRARATLRSASTWFSLCVLLLSALLAAFSQPVWVNACCRIQGDADRLASTLSGLCLRESAHGRADGFIAAAAADRWVSVGKCDAPQNLPPRSKRDVVQRIARYLPETRDDAQASKRLLATASLFWNDLLGRERAKTNLTSAILFAATATSGNGFDTADAFFEWLEPRRGTGGWDPQPIYEFKSVDVQKAFAKSLEEARRRKEQAGQPEEVQDRVAPMSAEP